MTYQEWKLTNADRHEFGRYYRRSFRRDLTEVRQQGSKCPMSFFESIQPRTVSTDNPVIAAMAESHRTGFALALFLTVLTDQVMYTHFHCQYARFRELTDYPKWRADCPGGCYSHMHPSHIMAAVGASAGQRLERIAAERLAALQEALPAFRREVQSFVREHLPELGPELWQRCMEEPPLSAFKYDLLLLPLRAAKYAD